MTAPVCTIDATGIHKPTLQDCLDYFIGEFRRIYGQDIYLGENSQDGQWLGIMSQALDDANSMVVATYNAFSPQTAQGVGLSTVVKINGLRRRTASYSTVELKIVGQAGTVIENGVTFDETSLSWMLPANVVIPDAGEIVVTAKCAVIGAINAAPGTISGIFVPVAGWQSVIDESTAIPGQPVETDAELRQRQAISTLGPSQTIMEGVIGALSALPNFSRVRGYENATDVTDDNGIPSHSLAIVIDGCEDNDIANVIAERKSFAGTHGSTEIELFDAFGVTRKIRFFRSTAVAIGFRITIDKFKNFTNDTQSAIKKSLVDFVKSFGIGNHVSYSKAWAATQLIGTGDSKLFEVTKIEINRDDGVFVQGNVAIEFNELPTCVVDDVSVIIT